MDAIEVLEEFRDSLPKDHPDCLGVIRAIEVLGVATEKTPQLFVLKRKGDTDYDEHAGFVIRAWNEDHARALAIKAATKAGAGEAAWNDPRETTCRLLTEMGRLGVILRDFRAG